MLIREDIEQREFSILNPNATHAAETKGRVHPEEECDIRTCYQRDRDRILHSKMFRRLKDKTQVFLSPEGDHYRTRLMHTLEVSQISRTIAKALMLNEDLVEAISLGHDLGHTPFGHAGERALNSICRYGFRHNEQSVRVAELIEREGRGLNLTYEVKDGMLNHSLKSFPSTMEGQIVRLSDKFAYIHHDMDDGERAGLLTEEQLPESLKQLFGRSVKERLNSMVHDVVKNSIGKDIISMSPDKEQGLIELREFMFRNLYTNPEAKKEEEKACTMIGELYDLYCKKPEYMAAEYIQLIKNGSEKERVICDYISGMTDQYCIKKFQQFFVPKSWSKY